MGDLIEAGRDVRVKHKLWLDASHLEDCLDRIVNRACWAKPIGVWLKMSLPLGFEGEPYDGLRGSFSHSRDAERPLLGGTGLGNPNPADRPCCSVECAQVADQSEPLVWSERSHSVNSSGFLSSIVLRYTPDREAPRCPGLHQ